MLVLTRYEGQSIRIGDDVTVKFLGYHRGRVRLGIDAPDDVKILRDELRDELHDDDNPQERAT